MNSSYDVLVLGSGIAGLSFALKAAQAGKSVAILTKKNQSRFQYELGAGWHCGGNGAG